MIFFSGAAKPSPLGFSEKPTLQFDMDQWRRKIFLSRGADDTGELTSSVMPFHAYTVQPWDLLGVCICSKTLKQF